MGILVPGTAEFEDLAARIHLRAEEIKFRQSRVLWPGGATALAYGAGVTTPGMLDIPPGTQSLTVLTTSGISSMTITGKASGYVYATFGASDGPINQRIPWSTPPDDQAVFSVVTTAAQSGGLFVTASPAPAAPANFTGQTAFALALRLVGTYDFTVPFQASAKGIIVFIKITSTSGGTLTVTIFNTSVTGMRASFLTSLGLNSNATTVLRIYPGLTTAANLIQNDVLSGSPQIEAVITGVAGSSVTFGIDYVSVS